MANTTIIIIAYQKDRTGKSTTTCNWFALYPIKIKNNVELTFEHVFFCNLR
ncbi:hypothetical protein [Paenibacillus sp. FSL R7-0331]|uniref:hypothetical protein n=1 Tax=Paenibacillus sp. FSL R7-0331 TaxID=1536773 RepID=UPI0012DFFFBE|nr:hypothetical protein [Paenibacillus sp. FSL R7-0331]